MLRILVAEDETPIREWIIFSIERSQNKNFNMIGSTQSGEEAYTLALKHKPDVIITDIKMPGIDGMELIKLVKSQLPDTTFIILSNYGEFSYAREAMEYGVKKYLLKSEIRGEDILHALEAIERESMQEALPSKDEELGFFYPEQVLWQETRDQIKKLNRSQIKRDFQELISDMEAQRFEQIAEEMEHWFKAFDEVADEDLPWAKEMCMKMVQTLTISISERAPEEVPKEINISHLHSMKQCQEICLDLLKQIGIHDSGQYSYTITEATKYIKKHYHEQITLIEIANYVCRSPEYFSRLFKEETGENFSVYLMMYRLNRAMELLETTDKKIYEIAYETGYTNPSYFSKIYKKYMGISPETSRSQNCYRKLK